MVMVRRSDLKDLKSSPKVSNHKTVRKNNYSLQLKKIILPHYSSMATVFADCHSHLQSCFRLFVPIYTCVLHLNGSTSPLAAASFSTTDTGFRNEAVAVKQMHIWELLEKTRFYLLVCHLCQSG